MKHDKAWHYAEAIHKATVGKSAKERRTIISQAASVANKKGDAALLPAILKAYMRSALRREQNESVHLEIADEHPRASEKKEIKERVVALGAGDAPLITHINPSITGGFRLEYKGALYDGSYRTRLVELYRKLVEEKSI